MVVSDLVRGWVFGGREDTSSLGTGTSEFVYLCLGSENTVVDLSQLVTVVSNSNRTKGQNK